MDLQKEIANCFPEIEKLFTQKELFYFKKTAKAALSLYHFSLGLWIRNNLLNRKKRLVKMFNEVNVYDADDMSHWIIEEFHTWIIIKYAKI